MKPNQTELQRWEGYVVEITKDSFFARLRDLTNLDGPDIEAEIITSQLNDKELEYLEVGAHFDWVIFGDSNETWSEFTFDKRRYTVEEIAALKERCRQSIERYRKLGWFDNNENRQTNRTPDDGNVSEKI